MACRRPSRAWAMLQRAVVVTVLMMLLLIIRVSSTSGPDALQVEEKGAAIAGRGDSRLRGARSHPLTSPLPLASPGWSHEAGLGAEPPGVTPSEENVKPDVDIRHERISEVSRALSEDDHNSRRQRNRRRRHQNSTSSGEESNGTLKVVISIGATALLGFGWCWLSTRVVWVSCCVCKRREPGQGSTNSNSWNQQGDCDDDVVVATACGTLAPVVCVYDGADIDGDELPAFQASTSQPSSTIGPSVAGGDRYGVDYGEGSNAGSFLFHRFLTAVPAAYPPSGVDSESSFPEFYNEFYSDQPEHEAFQVSGTTPKNEEEGEEELKCSNADITTTVAASQRSSLLFSEDRSGRGEVEPITPTTPRSSWKFLPVPRFWRTSRRDGSGNRQDSPDEEYSLSAASNSSVADVGGVEETHTSKIIGPRKTGTVSRQEITQGERRSGALARAEQGGETTQGNRTEGSCAALEYANASPSGRTTTTSQKRNAETGSKTFFERKPRDDVTIACCKIIDPDERELASRREDGRSDIASTDLPRARPMWRAFSEVDHDRIKENHSRATQRHLSRLNI